MTDGDAAPPGVTPSRAEVTPAPYECSSAPVPILMRHGVGARTDYAWVRTANEFRPITEVISGQVDSWNSLTQGGTAVVFEEFDPRPSPAEPWGNAPSAGVHLFDLTDGTVHRLAATLSVGLHHHLEFTTGPDGRIAVSEDFIPTFDDRRPTGRDFVLSVQVVAPGGPASREVFRHQAALIATGFDRPMQWSPDGALIALSIGDFSGDPMRPIPIRVLLLDASTGDVLHTLEDLRIAGSASWTPDSARLLVVNKDERVHLAEIPTGRLEPAPLPGPRSSGVRTWEVVGTAGNDHLLVYHQRGRTGRISTVRIPDGEERDVVSWRGELDMYVTAAQMPEGYWY